MSGLAGILTGRVPAGVYTWESALEVEQLRESVSVAGWSLCHLDGTRTANRAELLAEIGVVLDFPEYYGANFDAVHDCLRDLTAPTVLIWDEWGILASSDRAAFDLAVKVFAVRASDEQRPGFAVLLRGYGPTLEQVPELD